MSGSLAVENSDAKNATMLNRCSSPPHHPDTKASRCVESHDWGRTTKGGPRRHPNKPYSSEEFFLDCKGFEETLLSRRVG